jgi:subtilisin family serine protease
MGLHMASKATLFCFGAAMMLCLKAQAENRQAYADQMQRIRGSDSGKLHSTLRALTHASTGSNLARRLPVLGTDVAVNIVAAGDAQSLKEEVQNLGVKDAHAFGSMVSGRISVNALNALAAVPGVLSVRPALAHTNSGLVGSQGDRAQRSGLARRLFGVDGRGVRVGVLSDSFGCLTGPIFPGQMFTNTAEDMASDDLPSDVKILRDDQCATGLDEGRAIGQIIHDVAPGASLAFHTATFSEADFAQGIIDLADAGSTVIIDDVGYYDEPMFQDGIVAQAVDAVKRRGVAYFSSAGNAARASYESDWRTSKSVGVSGVRFNFGTQKHQDALQTISVTDQGLELVVLNWDQPFKSAGGKGSRSDVDLIFYDLEGNPIPDCDDNLLPAVCQFAGTDNNTGGDALEEGVISNTSGADVQIQLSIELNKGPTPGRLKYVYFDLGAGVMSVDEHDTQSGSAYGHPIAAGAEAVGAAAWYNTAAWNTPFHPECVPACLETFSSAGGVPILFDTNGNRLRNPLVRLKPEVTAPDGGNTTFFFSLYTATVPGSTEPDSFPNFFGTSAAAPHVAAIAALMLDKQRRLHKGDTLPPDRIYRILEETAQDMRFSAARTIGPFLFPDGTRGFDFDSGFGFVDAIAALERIGEFR